MPAAAGARTGWLELRNTPSGTSRLRVDEARDVVQLVPFAGQACEAVVLVGRVGQSVAGFAQTRVRYGRLALEPMRGSEQRARSALDILLGGQFGLWNDIEMEGREARNAPWLYAGYALTRPLRSGTWALGGNAGAQVGTRDFLRVRADPSDDPAADGVWFVRGVLEAAVERRLGERWTAGLAAGGAVATPVAAADRDVAGGLDAAWLAGAQVRYALSRNVELEGTTRALFGDQICACDADFAGDPRVHIFTRHALLFGLGLRMNF